ncbi:hypothetical protein AAV35_012580 [Salimicrobium jeotgali]|uniref:Uncharacterized protein n=1 Tax=Salimicrobium jeotgali TaxID=1230341 RepID=K2FHB1_9BACI|nr:hypothetical protein [Salimicrobium jeotgali]AKG05508.1 hypothetical protein AAV35_012580 [Salimicrobium jeotgali]EKE30511.1 hypothetical protein MJ3_13759 [Salimicrobium jeotgali]MBM7696660.1 hypothetical protein [Salimicrobium jeotgali]
MKPDTGTPMALTSQMLMGLSFPALKSLKQQSGAPVYQIICETLKVENVMNKREINDSFNNSAMNNVNIQSDVLEKYELSEKNLIALKEDIDRYSQNEMEKEQNEEFYERFKDSLNKDNKQEAKKYLTWILKGVGEVASVMTIGTTLGFW